MSKFGNKLQDYASGANQNGECQHPINKVNEQRFCTNCNTQLIAPVKTSPAARIAELEAQNKRLVEALGDTNAALIVTANDLSRHGGYAGENAYKIVTNARALLAELTA